MIKRSILAIGLIALSLGTHAETFSVDAEHSEIGFTVRHLMLSDVNGAFNTFQGTVEYDIENRSLVSLEGWIDAASIDTNSDKRDGHLKTADFFNVAEYPKLKFSSTNVEKTGDGTFIVTGNLNVLGTDRTVLLPVTVAGPIEDPWKNTRIGLSSETTLNRRELGITNSPAAVIGDDVRIRISAEAVLSKTAEE